MFSKECKLHLKEAKMTRWQHFKHAVGIAFQLKLAAGAVLVHSVAPRYFTTYASDTCRKITGQQDDK
jgi:uncharacterized metal-binding protein